MGHNSRAMLMKTHCPSRIRKLIGCAALIVVAGGVGILGCSKITHSEASIRIVLDAEREKDFVNILKDFAAA